MCIVKCIFSDQIIFMVHIPFKVLNINVIAAIIKQDGKSYENTQSELPIVNKAQNKFNQCED